VLEEVWELESYVEVKFGRDFDYEVMTEDEVNKLFFKLQIVQNEEDWQLSKSAFLQTIAGNKELRGSTKNKQKYGAFNPDELISIVKGFDPKKATLGKLIENYMKEVSGNNGRND
jgi:hypothetical protein